MKKNLLLALIVALVAMFAAACGAPTPEKICAKADEKERADCIKSLTEVKADLDKLNKDFWPEVATCLNKADKLTEDASTKCFAENKKLMEAMEKANKK